MNAKFIATLTVVLISLFGSCGVAKAQEGVPVGAWRGSFADGSGGVVLHVTGDGAFAIHITGGNVITGNWTWTASSKGGIITLHYINGGRPARLYYSVTWINGNSILFSDPWFRIQLNRM